jgi:hypothetical protein
MMPGELIGYAHINEVMAGPDDFIRSGQGQVPGVAAALFGRLPPRRPCNRLTELHFPARQQPPSRIWASLLPHKRHRVLRPRDNDQSCGYDQLFGLDHHTSRVATSPQAAGQAARNGGAQRRADFTAIW